MISSIRILAVPALAVLVSACTAFFPPDEDDDGVIRCDNVGDCEVPENSQWDVECVHGDDQDESTPKVCAPVFRIVGCDPQRDFASDSAVLQKYEEATSSKGIYVGCDDMNQAGTKGCDPRPGATDRCDDNMVINGFGVCDDPDAKYPAVPATPELAGKDVLDQFCRNYFCSEDWTCDASTGTPVCRPCATPNADGVPGVGEGGCAELYTKIEADGTVARSTVYDVDVTCGDGGLSPDVNTATRLAGEKIGPVPDGT